MQDLIEDRKILVVDENPTIVIPSTTSDDREKLQEGVIIQPKPVKK